MKARSLPFLRYSALGMTLVCCDEELPPRNDPDNLITVSASASYPGAPKRSDAITTKNSYWVYVKLKNNYDETLSGYAVFGGTLEIVWERDPSFKRTVQLDKTNLLTNGARFFDINSNIATLDPGKEMIWVFEWDWITDNSDTLTKLFPLRRDEGCVAWVVNRNGKNIGFNRPRWTSKEAFVVTGQVKLFRELAAASTPRIRQIVEYETFPNSECSRLPGF